MLRTLKKSLSLLLVVCLLTSFVGMAFAEGEVVPPPVDPPAPVDPAIVTIATVAAVAGDSITVDVSVTKNPGFSAYAFSVSYDDKVLTPTDATTLLTGAFTKNLAVENEVGSSILASFKGSEDITGDTVLFTMTFAVKADAKSASSAITATGKMQNLLPSELAVDIKGGKADIKARPYKISSEGDGNGLITVSKEEATIGETVSITAVANGGYRFKSWMSSDAVEFANPKSAKTTFKMLAKDVTVYATFEDNTQADRKVVLSALPADSGVATADKELYTAGASALIDAKPNDGFYFKEWQTKTTGAIIGSRYLPTTSLTIPDTDALITAVFAPLPVNTYSFTVHTDGNGSVKANNLYNYGTTVVLSAVPKSNYAFKEWRVSDNVSVADKKNPNLTIIMPASSVDVTAVFEYNPGKRYTVKVFPSRGGTAMSDKRDYLPGDHVILTATPNLGYLFYQWVKRDNITIVNDTARETSFIMPAYDVAINAEFVINPNIGTGGGGGGGGGGNGSGSKPPTFGSIFTVNFDSQGGTPIASATVYSNGTVAQPAAPTRDGHVFGGWYTQAACTDAYNFSSPVAKSFTLFARWMPIAVAEPYTDVTSSDWFYDDVIFLTKEGVVNGINGKLFCPNDNITRAQFAQILAKAADAKLADNTVDFSDIDVTSWYYKPIAWATANGIVNGVREKTFDPNAPISRQDMAVMISRYIKNILKKQLPPKGDMSEFADMAEVSEYAKAAVSEVKNCGIVGGNEKNEFEPLANATRAEACKMIHTLLTIAG